MTPEDAESVSAALNEPGGYMTPETLRRDLSDHAGGQDEAWLDERPIPGHPATWRDGIDYFDKLKFIEPDDAWMDQPIREGLDYLRTLRGKETRELTSPVSKPCHPPG